MRKLFLIVLMATSGISTIAQSDADYLAIEEGQGLLVGAQLSDYSFAELGYHYSFYTQAFIGGGYSFSALSNFRKEPTWGGKASFWLQWTVAHLENSVIYYTDLNGENSVHWRPELGIGYYLFKIAYGYQVPLINKDMPGLSRHQLVVNVRVPISFGKND